MALKVESERLDEIPVPFIAHSKRSGGQFLLVNNINGTVESIDEGGKKKQSSREEFSKEWDSVVLLAEKQEASGETNYAKQRKENCFLLCVLHLLSPAAEHVGCWSTTSSLETCRSSIPISCRGGGECSTTNGCPWQMENCEELSLQSGDSSLVRKR